MIKRGLIVLLLSLAWETSVLAQDGGGILTPAPRVPTLFDTVTVMPYVTGSLNLFSGKAFPLNATGPGIGGGLTFDFTNEGQKFGLMLDFAFQDMYGFAQNGNCVNPIAGQDSILEPANAYHYWQYVLIEPFLKIQTKGRQKGYFIIGASVGLAVLSETVSKGQTVTQFAQWDQSPYGNVFRLDLRAGLGVELAKFGRHELVLEARAGYPLTNVISNYTNACSGGDIGNWRIVTFQVNLGLRV